MVPEVGGISWRGGGQGPLAPAPKSDTVTITFKNVPLKRSDKFGQNYKKKYKQSKELSISSGKMGHTGFRCNVEEMEMNRLISLQITDSVYRLTTISMVSTDNIEAIDRKSDDRIGATLLRHTTRVTRK